MTEIDGLDIHFIHVLSDHENALPLIVTHGWPGSVIELKIVDPLTNPTAHGASASDAFHLVIPSMPGYGFSGKPTATGYSSGKFGGPPAVNVAVQPHAAHRIWRVSPSSSGHTSMLPAHRAQVMLAGFGMP